jgi:hypothetical protein
MTNGWMNYMSQPKAPLTGLLYDIRVGKVISAFCANKKEDHASFFALGLILEVNGTAGIVMSVLWCI